MLFLFGDIVFGVIVFKTLTLIFLCTDFVLRSYSFNFWSYSFQKFNIKFSLYRFCFDFDSKLSDLEAESIVKVEDIQYN